MSEDTKLMNNLERFDSIGDDTEGRFMRGAVIYNPAHIIKITPVARNVMGDCYCISAVSIDGSELKIKFHKKEAAEKFHQDIVSRWYPDEKGDV